MLHGHSPVPSFLRDLVASLAEQIGFDVQTLSYTLGLFLCYPLGIIMNMLPYGNIRHFFSFLLGTFLLQFILGVEWVHLLITSLVAYGMFMVLPRKTTAVLVPVFAMVYMVLGHMHRQYVNYLGYDLDFTGSQMVITQKLYMMAFNLYDGELLAAGKESRAAKKCKEYAVPKLPSLIEFLGYTFCFSNVIAGPATEFTIYEKACTGSHMYTADGKAKGKIPSNVIPTLKPFLTCLTNLVVFVVIGAHFQLLDPADPKNSTPVVLTEEFLKKAWLVRFAYLWMGLLIVRQKYYFAWKCADGACNIWYAGFEGFDEEGKAKGWDYYNNNNIIAFETAPSIQVLSKEWNRNTAKWLARYVYMRTGGSLLATYGMSAFWHGFYPGYYLFFLSVPLFTFCERIGRKKLNPIFGNNFLYDIACRIATSMCAEYGVSAFVLLSFDWSWATWKSHYFFGHIGPILFYFVMTMIPSSKKATSS